MQWNEIVIIKISHSFHCIKKRMNAIAKKMTLEQAIGIALGCLLTFIFGWLASSFSKVSKKDMEKMHEEIDARINRIETAGFVSRAELKESINVVKELMEAHQKTIDSNFKTLFYEVRKRKDDD